MNCNERRLLRRRSFLLAPGTRYPTPDTSGLGAGAHCSGVRDSAPVIAQTPTTTVVTISTSRISQQSRLSTPVGAAIHIPAAPNRAGSPIARPYLRRVLVTAWLLCLWEIARREHRRQLERDRPALLHGTSREHSAALPANTCASAVPNDNGSSKCPHESGEPRRLAGAHDTTTPPAPKDLAREAAGSPARAAAATARPRGAA